MFEFDIVFYLCPHCRVAGMNTCSYLYSSTIDIKS